MATIAEILLKAGQDAANARREQGAITGQAISDIGKTLANIPVQYRQAQVAQEEDQARKLQLQGLQQKASDLKALDTAYAAPGGREAIIASLPGHLRADAESHFADMDKLAEETRTAKIKSDEATQNYVASQAQRIAAYGYDPNAAQLVISHAKSVFANDPSSLSQVQQIEQAIQQNPTPEGIKAVIGPLVPKQADYTLKPGEERVSGDTNKPIVSNPKEVAAPAVKTEWEAAMDAAVSKYGAKSWDALTPSQKAETIKDYRTPVRNPDAVTAAADAKQAATDAKNTAQQTSSYQFHTEQLKPIAAPISQKNDEIANLYTLLNQHNPQADADVAPKLLSLFAGGPGTGLRMNQATIDRNAGGHTAWVGLQETLNKFSTDPTHAQIPEAQRQQIYQLLGVAQGQVKNKLAAIQDYQKVLADPESTVTQHRQGFANLQSKLTNIESDPGYSAKGNAKTVSVDEVKAVAAARGQTYAEAKKDAESEGYIVQ